MRTAGAVTVGRVLKPQVGADLLRAWQREARVVRRGVKAPAGLGAFPAMGIGVHV